MSWEYLRVVVVARVRRDASRASCGGATMRRARETLLDALETDEADVARAMRRRADARAALDRCA